MYEHFIIVSSAFSYGHRIAWRYTDTKISTDVLMKIKKHAEDVLGKPSFSIHRLSTEGASWADVVKKDSFFGEHKLIENFDEFLHIIKADKEVLALDVARFLISSLSMTHLKLQKLLYLVYAEYLERTGKKLFKAPIKAYPYGPVVPEVYEHYKKYGRSYIPADETDFTIEAEIKNKPVMIAKLLASDDSDVIFAVIKHVLEVYGAKTPSELVSITHAENAPWSHTKDRDIISDEDILKYHQFERNYLCKPLI